MPRAPALLLLLALVPVALAQDAPPEGDLPPLEARAVDVPAGAPALVALALDANATSASRFVLFLGGGLVEAGEVDVELLANDTRVATWSWSDPAQPLEPRAFVLDARARPVSVRLASAEGARAYLYHDVPCDCPKKQLSFPGAFAAFNRSLNDSDSTILDVRADFDLDIGYEVSVAEGSDLRTIARHPEDRLPNGSLAWTHPRAGDALLLVRALEGAGEVSPRWVVTPAPPGRESFLPAAPLALGLAGLALAARLRKRA